MPEMSEEERPWDVLLLGGASGTGKSTVSYPLARHFGVALMEADDFTTVLERMTTPRAAPHPALLEDAPGGHALARRGHPGAALGGRPGLTGPRWRRSSRGTWKAGRRPSWRATICCLPWRLRLTSPGCPPRGGCGRSSWSKTTSAAWCRTSWGREPEAGEQDMRARVSWLYGQWLQEEAQHYGLAALPARPWDDLLDRVLAAANKPW